MPPFFEHQDEASFSTCSGMEHKRAQHEQKPRRCVRFASFHETCEISHIEDMPQDVIENVWMSADELSFLRTSCATIIMNIEEALARWNLRPGARKART